MVNVINVVLNSNPDRINHEAITAAAFGCMAALDTEKYLRNQTA